MSDLFIASRSIPHKDDGKRRVLAVGRTKGGSALLQMSARFGDLQATGTREAAEEAAGIAAVAAAGRRAWDLHKAAAEADGRTCADEETS